MDIYILYHIFREIQRRRVKYLKEKDMGSTTELSDSMTLIICPLNKLGGVNYI